MTEDEKKEFEEFLQWKAERAKRMKSEDLSADAKDKSDTENEQIAPSAETEVKPNTSEPQKEANGNPVLIVALAFVAIIVLAFVLIGLSGNNNRDTSFAEVEDSVTVDTIAAAPIAYSAIDAKQDSIARAERISTLKKTIRITSAYLGRPNSASGVDAYFYYKNLSDKTIKYLVWEGYPMNAVGDRVSCDIRGYRDYRGRDTGPVKPGKSSGGCWGCAWYNSTAKKLVLTGIEIEYMDGSTFTIKENEIEHVR